VTVFFFGGCKILSDPLKQPIGEITSTTWSPTLKRRIGMGYISPEYAQHNHAILISHPSNDEEHHRKKQWQRRRKDRYIKGHVVRLPFIPHNYRSTSTASVPFSRSNSQTVAVGKLGEYPVKVSQFVALKRLMPHSINRTEEESPLTVKQKVLRRRESLKRK